MELFDHILAPLDGSVIAVCVLQDPGYIKGYPPGIRENGGQYTHAAIWTVWAMVELGQGDLAEALFRLLNPIYHCDTPRKADRYRVEPYVIAADVYGERPFIGRGGWTWYTGSAGWFYRLGLEAILGLPARGKRCALHLVFPEDGQAIPSPIDMATRFIISRWRILMA